MPVILDLESYDFWLDPAMQDVAGLFELLEPYDARFMRCYPSEQSHQSRWKR